MTKDTYRSQFRLPYDLYEALKDAAEENRRSLNAELVERLEKSFATSDVKKPATFEEVADLLNKIYEQGRAHREQS